MIQSFLMRLFAVVEDNGNLVELVKQTGLLTPKDLSVWSLLTLSQNFSKQVLTLILNFL